LKQPGERQCGSLEREENENWNRREEWIDSNTTPIFSKKKNSRGKASLKCGRGKKNNHLAKTHQRKEYSWS